MPELPPLRVKVDVDTRQLDEAALKMEAFGAAAERHLAPAGDAFIKLGERGEIASLRISSSTAKTAQELQNLEDRARKWASDIGPSFERGTQAVLRMGDDGTVAIQKLGQTIVGATPAVTGFATNLSSLGAIGGAVIPILIGVGVALVAMTAPAIAAAAGLSAVLLLGGGLLAAFAAFGVAAVALTAHYQGWSGATQAAARAQAALAIATNQNESAQEALVLAQLAVANSANPSAMALQRLADAQEQADESAQKMADAQDAANKATANAVNPLTQLQAHLDSAAKSMSDRMAPSAVALVGFLDSLIDPATRAGTAINEWFGARLPRVLDEAKILFDILLGSILDLGNQLGPIFDRLVKDPTRFEVAFSKVAGQVVAAIVGIVQNLVKLANWFEGPEGQKMQSQAGVIFSVIGSTMQVVITVLYAIAVAASMMGDQFDRTGRVLRAASDTIGAAFDKIGGAAHGAEIAVGNLIDKLSHVPGAGALANLAGDVGKFLTNPGAQHGGIFPPGAVFKVGEVAQETAMALPGGGVAVIPDHSPGHRGGGDVHLHLEGATFTSAALARAIVGDMVRELKWSWR